MQDNLSHGLKGNEGSEQQHKYIYILHAFILTNNCVDLEKTIVTDKSLGAMALKINP